MNKEIHTYNKTLIVNDQEICCVLHDEICKHLPKAESKIWHGHPVWFLEENPIVGYDKLKAGVRLLFWSGVTFEEEQLMPSKSGKFKDASITYTSAEQINTKDLKRWLKKANDIQWDYKNVVKRKGVLERLK
jgi:hypothetical protein